MVYTIVGGTTSYGTTNHGTWNNDTTAFQPMLNRFGSKPYNYGGSCGCSADSYSMKGQDTKSNCDHDEASLCKTPAPVVGMYERHHISSFSKPQVSNVELDNCENKKRVTEIMTGTKVTTPWTLKSGQEFHSWHTQK